MDTNWIVPSAALLPQVIALSVLQKSNENIDNDSQQAALSTNPPREPGSVPFDSALENRADDLIDLVVAQIRETIQIAGKVPLSLTPGSVPPKAVKHVLNIAAYQLINSTPGLLAIVMTEHGGFAPFQTFHKEGLDYIAKLEKGMYVLPPTDPTGQDYLTAVNVPWGGVGTSPFGVYDSTKPINPPIEPVRVGGMSDEADLQTEGALSEKPVGEWKFPVNTLGQP